MTGKEEGKKDAFEELPRLEGGSVDCVITDPPYDFSEAQKDFLATQFLRISKGHVLVFCPPENQFHSPKYLFWVKPTSTKNYSKSHGRFVEMIAHWPRGKTFNQLFWANMTGVYHDVIETQNHEYKKPESLIRRLILIHTNPGDTILDPFAGSGTVKKCAEELGRKCISFTI